MKKEWLNEIVRDIIALGGLPFFVIVLIRVFILPDYPYYLSQFAVAGVIFFISMLLFKQNLHAGLGLILLVFTTLLYEDVRFGILVGILYIFLIAGLIYLKKDKKKIFIGILIGGVSSLISYYFVEWAFSLF